MQQDIFIRIITDSWYNQLRNVTKLFEGLTDEDLAKETAANRNTGIYLLGHLIAVHDHLLPLLGLGEKLHPELEEVFIKNPDRSGIEKPSIPLLRKYWDEVNATLATHFATLSTDDWFQRHTSVTAEDFAKEPHRNRANVLISRTNHLSYHYGQLAYLKS